MPAPPDPFDLIRSWFQSFNSGEIDALVALYDERAIVDWGGESATGCDGIRESLASMISRSARRTVRMIARVETGAMHAEWRGTEEMPGTRELSTTAGYDDFTIDGGLIHRQRSVRHPLTFDGIDEVMAPSSVTRPSRQYPSQPIVGVGAVIIQNGTIVLVKRRYEPLAGQWSLPGGRLELGETLEAGLAREMLEETGLLVEVGPVVDVFDRILLDPERKVRYHYVLIDYLCRPVGGSLAHGSDVAAAEFADPADLTQYRLTPKAMAVIEKAVARARTHQWEPNGL